MKIVVTGGAGFIGSNLCETLLQEGNKVVCLDNFSTGKRENIASFLSNPDFTLIEGDIRDPETCRRAVDGMEYVLHEAALGSVPRSIKDPVGTNEVNVSGFLNMLVASRDAGIKRFVYASSSSVYGDSSGLPKVEDTIGKPLSPYAVTKYVNELYAGVFARTYGLEYIGLRYFNVFGKRQDPDGAYAAVIPLFVKKLMNHQPPVINGDGEHSRDFTYIKNVVQMNLSALAATRTEALNRVYNTACGERTTLNRLVAYLKEYLGAYDPRIRHIRERHGPGRPGDISHSIASVDKARKLLNCHPAYRMKDGLKETVRWYWENFK